MCPQEHVAAAIALALTVAAPATRAEPVVRFDVAAPAGLVATGNTLGLAGDESGPLATDRIGVFTDAAAVLRADGWPLGTTADWRLASSEAVLDLPDGATVLHAALVWSGSVDAGVLAALDEPVELTTPSGVTWQVPPADATAARFGGPAFGTEYYGRTADVTAIIEGAGRYRVGAVPATLDAPDAAAGWSLYVAYTAADLPPRRVTLVTFMELLAPDGDGARVTHRLDGLCLPLDPAERVAHLVLSALDGDVATGGDSFRIAASETGLADDESRLGALTLPADNLFAARITDSQGLVDTRGTFGALDHTGGTYTAGARQGWDLVNVSAASLIDPSWSSAWLRGTSSEDRVGLVAAGISLALAVPHLADDGEVISADPAVTASAGVVRISVRLANTGTAAATDMIFRLPGPLPLPVRYVARSFLVDGAAPPGGPVDDGAALVAGIALPDAAPGQALVVTLELELVAADVAGSFAFSPRVAYANGACPSLPALELAPAPLVLQLTTSVCGDGTRDESEGCDDGDRSAGDGCDGECRVEAGWSCDDGSPNRCAEVCGDGRIVGTEVCDDGNTVSAPADGCTATCRGVDKGWSCLGEPSSCRTRCDDGVVAVGVEACDDGNRADGDGCASDCTSVEAGWSCSREPSICRPSCGDAILRETEACDDGNDDNGDGCSASCAFEAGWLCVQPSDDTATLCRRDEDGDGVVDDGDDSGDPFDNPCPEGSPIAGCDDNCPGFANPDQSFPEDARGVCPPYFGPRTRGGGGCAGGGGGGAVLFGAAVLAALAWSSRHRRRRGSPLALLLVMTVADVPGARAQEVDPRLFEPTLSPLGVLGVESSATSAHLRPWVNMVVSLADDELAETTLDGVKTGALDQRLLMTFAAGFGLLDRFDVAMGFPVAIAEGSVRPDGDMGMTDLRLSLRGRALGPLLGGEGFGLAFGLHLTLPTGSDTPFMSDGGVTAMPQVVVDYRDAGGFIAAFNLGYRVRPERTFDDLVVGDELRFGLGAEVPVGFYGFAFVAELAGALSFAESPHDDGGLSAREAPVELLGGLRWRSAGGVTLSGAVGGGLSEGYGAPDFRVLFGVAFNVPPPDRYEEPIVPASRNEVRDTWGRRDPIDRGPSGPEVTPERFDQLAATDPDPDSDGVPVPADVCPTIPEDLDGFNDDDGCPDPDNDADGVFDADDQCPDEMETLNGNMDFDGCHDEPKPTEGQGIKDDRIEIHDRIQFKPGSDELLDSDKLILDQVAVVIRANPAIQRFRIEGHTDNLGDREFNVDLAERRAWRVREYLIDKGIEPGRLFPKGFGSTRPIAKNTTEAGRAKNRRVEFHIVRPGEPNEGDLP